MAGSGLTWHLPVTTVAGRGLMWPDAGGRWLPVWLPQFVSSANIQRTRTKSETHLDCRPEWPARSHRGQCARCPATRTSAVSAPNRRKARRGSTFGVGPGSSRLPATAAPEDRYGSICASSRWDGAAVPLLEPRRVAVDLRPDVVKVIALAQRCDNRQRIRRDCPCSSDGAWGCDAGPGIILQRGAKQPIKIRNDKVLNRHSGHEVAHDRQP
jgi:hypothetical protein